MNPSEQRQRKTAVDQLAADTELVIGKFSDEVRSGLIQEHAAWSNALNAEKSVRQSADRAIGACCDERHVAWCEADAQMAERLLSLTEPLRRGFWGRLKHLVSGR